MRQDELRKLAQAATPGPWERSWLYEIYPGTRTRKEQDDNAAYIAAANPATVLALLARVEALQTVMEKISDPRKRDHKEPDAYTQLGCVMNLASEVLAAHGPNVPMEGEKK